MVMSFLESFFSKKKREVPSKEIELVEFQGTQIPVSELNLKEIEYRIDDVTFTPSIRTGGYGMIHHCFDNEKDAQNFLQALMRHSDFLDANAKEKAGFAKARVTKTKEDPNYQGNDFFRIRLSLKQFELFHQAFDPKQQEKQVPAPRLST